MLAHVRAALIALHLFAITLMAIPAPDGGMNRSAWADPTVQGEFQAWSGRLNALGIDVDPPALEAWAWEFAQRWVSGREAVLAPFMPYYRHCGTWQSWRMFVAPHRYPTRLHIDVQEGGAWRPVYASRSTEHRWRAHQLDHDRTHAAVFRFGWRHFRRHYQQFGQWIASRAAEDFPDAERVRIRFWKFRTASPEEVRERREPEGRWESAIDLSLAERR